MIHQNPTYEEVLELAQLAEQKITQGKWLLGDLANLLVNGGVEHPTKGQFDTLAAFADDTNISRRAMQEYAQLTAFYPPDSRELYPNVSYTHYRHAYRYSESLEDALTALNHASSEGLTCGAFEAWLKQDNSPRPTTNIRLPRQLLVEAVQWLEVNNAELANKLREWL